MVCTYSGGHAGMVFAEVDFEEPFGGQNVDGQASVPQGNAEAQFRLALKVDLVALWMPTTRTRSNAACATALGFNEA